MFDFEKFKKKVNEVNLVTKTISYNDIEIVSMNEVLIMNVPFKLYNNNVLRGFLKQLGLSKTVFDSFNNTLKDDEKRLQFLLNTIKRTLVSHKNNTIDIILNEKTLKIVGFKGSSRKNLNISNKGMLNLLDETMNNNSNLSIVNGSIDNGGNMIITTIDKNNEFSIKGMSDEVFKTGLTFMNNPINTVISPFNERLICTNGMTTTTKEMSITIKNKKDGINEFIHNVRNFDHNNFKTKFSEQVKLLSNSIASYNELYDVSKILEKKLNLGLDVVNEHLRITDFIYTFNKKTGQHINSFDKTRQKQIKTHIDKWSLINIVTDLSSHTKKYGINVKPQTSLEVQVMSGKMVMDTPDILKVPQIF